MRECVNNLWGAFPRELIMNTHTYMQTNTHIYIYASTDKLNSTQKQAPALFGNLHEDCVTVGVQYTMNLDTLILINLSQAHAPNNNLIS